VPGGQQHQRHADDLGGAARDQIVDGLIDGG
jgi:hypothetical protein